jgi:hypothetical protein
MNYEKNIGRLDNFRDPFRSFVFHFTARAGSRSCPCDRTARTRARYGSCACIRAGP